MKLDTLINKMKRLGVSLPSFGTGLNGRILAVDLESALGDYYFDKYFCPGTSRGLHYQLRRSITPMKAFRYDKLKPTEQVDALDIDSNEWVAEEKFNGWRIVVTYIPEDGFCFWSGNISDVNFLPVNYTNHVLLQTKNNKPVDPYFFNECFIMDTEAVCFDQVETLEGMLSTNTLDAVGAILGSNTDRATEIQRKNSVTLQFMCFDVVFPNSPEALKTPFIHRRENLIQILANCNVSNFQLAEQKTKGKRRFLNSLWARGAEGVVLKNITKPYVSGGRVKTHAIKVKRSMSGEIGDNIDAFISGFIITPEYAKRGLIGGLELSVYTANGRKHHIATVTGISDTLRKEMTTMSSGEPCLDERFYNKVVVVDGQELSSRHRKLMHAKIDWLTGFRKDKIASDCVLDLTDLDEARY